jgi:excisionase family DNA binding protein
MISADKSRVVSLEQEKGPRMPKIARATVTVEEAAKRLGIGRNQGYEGVRRGDIPSIKIGKRILVPVAALDRLLGIEPGRTSEAA